MKAFIHRGNEGLENTYVTEHPEPVPKANEVKIKLRAAGLNHRDIWSLHRRGKDASPVVLGSDGAGVVVEVGQDVKDVLIGKEVIINPSLHWPDKSSAPPAEFEILGVPGDGTFAEYVTVPYENIEKKPPHLSWEEAGVFPLAALTAYRALFTRANLQAKQTVLIPGIGSGVATFVLQMTKAHGATTIVTSRSEAKLQFAQQLGADILLDTNSDWEKALRGEKVDIVIDSVGEATWQKVLQVLKPGGTIVNFGATSGKLVEINLQDFYFGQYNILGTTMGSREEFTEMIQFIEKHKIKPVIDRVFPLDETHEAFRRMDEGSQFGKIGIKISDE
jgi:zinc-binding alcohol dehydrogenase/oxidoreductase